MSPDATQKILFVDDEKNILDGLRRQLHKDFTIETACSGELGLEVLQQNGPFAVVVSDLRMPGMDGMAFLQQVRKLSPDTVCVILTGFADLEAAMTAVNEKRIFRFLTKPCPTDKLKSTLHECLDYSLRLMAMSSYTYTTYVEEGQAVWTDRSKGCLAVTGYAAQDFVQDGSLWLEIALPEFREAACRQREEAVAGREVAPIEIKIRKRDGAVRWIRDSVIPHFNDSGRVWKYDGLVEDITERKEMEQALHHSEARYERMVANVPGVVYQLLQQSDGSLEFIFLSDSCRDLLGIEAEPVRQNSKLFFDNLDPDEAREFIDLLHHAGDSMDPWEWWGRWNTHGKQKWFQCVARPERVDSGGILWDGLMIDVTELRRVEEEARLLAKLSSENPNPVLRMAADGRIIYANKASDILLNLWGCRVDETFPVDVIEMAQGARKGGKPECQEMQVGKRIYSTVFAPITEGDYINIYARDITETKQAELELIRANEVLREHDRLKSEFVSTVSHELRTPLCIFKNIISNALAGVTGKISFQLREQLEMADKSVDRLSRIIGDFLDISKMESGRMELGMIEFDIGDVVEEIVDSMKPLADAKEISLRISGPVQPLVITADRDRIIQVLTNLVGNAIKFINGPGHIHLYIEDQGDEVEVAVQDDGPGLSADELEKIFDRFVQVHKLLGPGEHGTGLGLTIAKQIVEMHHGRMWADSAPGQGCCFRFALPKTQQAAAARAAATQHVHHRVEATDDDPTSAGG